MLAGTQSQARTPLAAWRQLRQPTLMLLPETGREAWWPPLLALSDAWRQLRPPPLPSLLWAQMQWAAPCLGQQLQLQEPLSAEAAAVLSKLMRIRRALEKLQACNNVAGQPTCSCALLEEYCLLPAPLQNGHVKGGGKGTIHSAVGGISGIVSCLKSPAVLLTNRGSDQMAGFWMHPVCSSSPTNHPRSL